MAVTPPEVDVCIGGRIDGINKECVSLEESTTKFDGLEAVDGDDVDSLGDSLLRSQSVKNINHILCMKMTFKLRTF